MISGKFIQKRSIQWFDKSCIDKRRPSATLLKFTTDLFTDLSHASYGNDCQIFASVQDFTSAILDRAFEFFKSQICAASRVADRNRSTGADCKLQHFPEFPCILWCHHGHVWHHREIRKVETSLMCLSVRTDKTRAVNGKDHMKILHTDIMHHLIHCSLQEGRIDRHNRNHPAKCQSCCKRNSMLLCDSHIKQSVRIFLLKSDKSGSFFHGCSDADQSVMFFTEIHHRIRKNIRIGRSFFLR